MKRFKGWLMGSGLLVLAVVASAQSSDSRSIWDRVTGKTKAAAASEVVARQGMRAVFAGQTKTVVDDRGWTVVSVEILKDGKARFTPYSGNRAGAAVDVAASPDGSYTFTADKGPGNVPLIDDVMVKGKGKAGSACAPAVIRAMPGNVLNDKGQSVYGWKVTAQLQVARGGGENPCSETMPHEFTSK
jgi:hypothetical protein